MYSPRNGINLGSYICVNILVFLYVSPAGTAGKQICERNNPIMMSSQTALCHFVILQLLFVIWTLTMLRKYSTEEDTVIMFFWARLFENIKHNQQEDINTSKKRVIKSPGTAEMARAGPGCVLLWGQLNCRMQTLSIVST